MLDGLAPGTAIPESLRPLTGLDSAGVVTQCVVSGYSVNELGLLQAADLVIQEVLRFWRQGTRPGPDEHRRMTKAALTLLRQWDRLIEQVSMLYCRVHCPKGKEGMLQLVLTVVLSQRC